MNLIKKKILEWFSLDYRSLAILRIGMGVLIILDLLQRSNSFFAHYTDGGVLPRADLLTLYQNKWFISIHLISGLGIVEALLFITAGIFALMMIFGYRTKIATIVSWFLLISLHDRNPMILQGGDVFFRTILFWMMFLPTELRYSLDRLFNRVAPPTEKVFVGMASVGYILQICILYFFTGILKTGPAWHGDNSAVYYALAIDQLITPVGALLNKIPNISSFFTPITLYLETYGSLLFFSPIFSGPIRLLGIILFALLQIGFNMSMRLGLFGAIAIIATLGLLPSYFWDTIINKVKKYFSSNAKQGLSIYYDGDCTFCYKLSYLLKRILFLSPSTILLPAYANKEIESVMSANNSWVIVDATGNQYLGWQGVITIFSYSPVFKPLSYLFKISLIKKIGGRLYHFVATRRKQVCLPLPIEKAKPNRKLIISMRESILLFLIVYVICWNIDTLGKTKIINNKSNWIGYTLRLDQQFNMFAPTPLTEDGWYIFPAKLKNGELVDIFTGGPEVVAKPISYVKPKWIAYIYQDQRWQKFLMNLWIDKNKKYRLPYGKYICRTWNSAHGGDEKLMTFEMVFMLENTLPYDKTEPIKPVTIWKHSCF